MSKMEHFAKIGNGFYPLTIFAKRSILDIWQGSEYASGLFCSFLMVDSIVVSLFIYFINSLIKLSLSTQTL